MSMKLWFYDTVFYAVNQTAEGCLLQSM